MASRNDMQGNLGLMESDHSPVDVVDNKGVSASNDFRKKNWVYGWLDLFVGLHCWLIEGVLVNCEK